WLVLHDAGRAGELQTGALMEAADWAGERKIRVLVPGTEVLMLEASIPTRNTQKLLQALPYALEDQLAGSVEDQHFAAATRTAGGQIPVAVVAREHMDNWLAQLEDAGIDADTLTPDFLCLPINDDAVTLATTSNGLLLRNGAAQGCRVQTALIPEILKQTLTQHEPPPVAVDLYGSPDAAITARLEKADIAVQTHDTELFPLLAANASRPVLDLLQGDYKKRRENTEWWQPWRVPAALAAVLLLIVLGTQISRYFILKGKNETLMQQMNAVMQQAFPGARESTFPRADMESRLSAMQNSGDNGSGFLPLVHDVGMALSEVPDAHLNALSYRSGRLEISVLADGVQSLDQLKTLLTKDGELHVEIQAANNRDNKVEGRLLIVPAGDK
ncbi:MAG TPA: type II secretion system protein GspL, partial [Gammaproteobacteria bacterium]|nr:type II secretion system protein GspL [Gammaproteobacteria bacterium]